MLLPPFFPLKQLVKLFETWEVILRAKGSCWGQEEMERVTGRNKGVGLMIAG